MDTSSRPAAARGARLALPMLALLLMTVLAGALPASADSSYYQYSETDQAGDEVEVNATYTPSIDYDTPLNTTWSDWSNTHTANYIDLTLTNASTNPWLNASDSRSTSMDLDIQLQARYADIARASKTADFTTTDAATPDSTSGSLLSEVIEADEVELHVRAGPNADEYSVAFNLTDDASAIGFDLTPEVAVQVYVNGSEVGVGEVDLTDPAFIELIAIDEDDDSNITITPIRIRNSTSGVEYDSQTRVDVTSNTSIKITVETNETIAGTDNVIVDMSFVHGWGDAPRRDVGLVQDGELIWCVEAPTWCTTEIENSTALDDGDSVVVQYQLTSEFVYGLQKIGGYETATVTMEVDSTGGQCAKMDLDGYVLGTNTTVSQMAANDAGTPTKLGGQGHITLAEGFEPAGSYSWNAPTASFSDGSESFGTSSNAECYDDGDEVLLDLNALENWSTQDPQVHVDSGHYDGDEIFTFTYVMSVDYVSASSDVFVLDLLDSNSAEIVALSSDDLESANILSQNGQYTYNVPPLQVNVIFPEEPTAATSTSTTRADGSEARCDTADYTSSASRTLMTVKKRVDGEWAYWALEDGEWQVASTTTSTDEYTFQKTGGEVEKEIHFTEGEFLVECFAYGPGAAYDTDVAYVNISSSATGGGTLAEDDQVFTAFVFIVIAIGLIIVGLVFGLGGAWWGWLLVMLGVALIAGPSAIEAWNALWA